MPQESMTALERMQDQVRQRELASSFEPETNRLSAAATQAAKRLTMMADAVLSVVDLTERQYSVLCAVDQGCTTASQAARAVGVTPQTMSYVMEGLLVKKMIRRRAARSREVGQGHALRLSLTPRGRDAMADAKIRMEKMDARLSVALGPGEFDATARALEGLLESLARAAECSAL